MLQREDRSGARRRRVKVGVTAFLLAFVVLVVLQGRPSPLTDLQLPAYIGVAIVGLALTVYLRSDAMGVVVTAGMYLLLKLPTVTTGYFRGLDSWKYIGSARIIASKGWAPDGGITVAHSNQFPGLQLLTVAITNLLGVGLVPVTEYLPLLLNAVVLLTVVAIGRLVGMRLWQATLPTIAVSTFFLFAAFSTYHHLLLGYFTLYLLLLVVLKLQGSTRRKRWLVVLLVGMMTLSISHQYSSFLFGVLLAVTAIIPGVRAWVTSGWRTPRPLWTRRYKASLVLVFLFANLLYYLWIGDEFLLAIFAMMASATTTVPPPKPELVDAFVLLNTESLLVQLTTSYLIVSVFLLALSLVAILLVERSWRRLPEEPLSKLVLGGWVIVIIMMIPLAKVLPLVNSIRRVVKFAVPLLLVALVLEWIAADRRRAANIAVGVGLCTFVVMGMMMYPAHLIGDQNPQYSNRYRVTIDQDQRATLEWAFDHSNRMVADTMARQYLQGSQRGYHIVESQIAYLGCRESKPSLLLVREGFRRIMFMRSQPYQYAIPESYFRRFDRRGCLRQVYDNGRGRLYWSSAGGQESAAVG